MKTLLTVLFIICMFLTCSHFVGNQIGEGVEKIFQVAAILGG